MIASMTGFGAYSKVFDFSETKQSVELKVEIKTLNSKALDLHLRFPRPYSAYEGEIQSWIRQRIERGRVEVHLHRKVLKGPVEELSLNLEQAESVHGNFLKLSEHLKLDKQPELQDLLQLPDWLETQEVPVLWKQESSALREVINLVLDQVIEGRKNEGAALLQIMKSHLKEFRKIFDQFKENSALQVEAFRTRLRERLDELRADTQLDPQRVEQEIVFWAAKSDTQEEIDRLSHHIEELQRRLESKGLVGRSIEFIIQEMHRELNTLGSKAPEVQVTHQVIELKSIVERMKEQVQNIE